MIHKLKTWQPYFDDTLTGRKTFELRKNDRNYQSDDILVLLAYDHIKKVYLRRLSIYCRVTYVLPGGQFGLDPDYCVMGIEIVDDMDDIHAIDQGCLICGRTPIKLYRYVVCSVACYNEYYHRTTNEIPF